MVAAVMLMLPAAGCASRLSADFDEREVQEKAEEIAELSCTGKIGEAYGMLSEMMKAQITEDQIRAGIEGTIEPLGGFRKDQRNQYQRTEGQGHGNRIRAGHCNGSVFGRQGTVYHFL